MHGWRDIERCSPLTANDHAVAVHEVAHELPGLADELDASRTAASIARHVQDTADLTVAESHGCDTGVLEFFVKNAGYFKVHMAHLITGQIAQQVEQVNPGVQNRPAPGVGKIVHPITIWRLQALAHTDGVDGADFVE